ncbi:MAG: hypothetical protein HC869_26655 [Rhodospirillales bacterium]|nr:hypothetical protein [Rhodospirillales bacterium]
MNVNAIALSAVLLGAGLLHSADASALVTDGPSGPVRDLAQATAGEPQGAFAAIAAALVAAFRNLHGDGRARARGEVKR